MKQYQFKLSADLKRIIVRKLPDFKERYLRDPKLDGPTGEQDMLRFSKEIVVSNAAELKWRKSLLRLIDTRLRDAKRKQNTSEIERLQKMQIEVRQAPAAPGADHPKVRAAIHRALKTQRQAIRRELKRMPTRGMRTELESGLKQLSDMETQMFGVQHRTTNRPLDTTGKTYTPMTARGRRHVPVAALPFDARGRRYIPSPREIVENAAFRKYADKGNIEMALAKLAAINPRKYGWLVRKEAKIHPRVRRARNRVGSDVEIGWPPKNDEALVLDNFYATKLLERPLMGVAYDEAVRMLNGESASRGKTLAEKLEGENEITPFRYQFGGKPLKGDPERKMNVGRYRRILKKFFLPS